MINDKDVIDQAIAWHLRLEEASVETWQAFTIWLSADEAHAAAYDRIALDDAMLPMPAVAPTAPPVEVANDDLPARRTRWLIAGSGITAVAAALMAVLFMPAQAPTPQAMLATIETAPGTTRQVQLSDGTTVMLNGGTKLTIDRNDPRVATLESGQALFHVRHDAAHPFELRTGGAVLRDLGTVFDVTRDGARLNVQVAEGGVLFNPDREAVKLQQGNALTMQQDRIVLTRVEPAEVGAWQSGQLSFRSEPMDAVARAVNRATGANITLQGGLAAQSFTGSFSVKGGAATVVPQVATLTGSRWRREGDRWTLSPGRDGTF